MAQDPDFIARFRDYNDYLDSLIAEEDIRYLQDGELARFVGILLKMPNAKCQIINATFLQNGYFSDLLLSSPIVELVGH